MAMFTHRGDLAAAAMNSSKAEHSVWGEKTLQQLWKLASPRSFAARLFGGTVDSAGFCFMRPNVEVTGVPALSARPVDCRVSHFEIAD